MIVSDEQQRGLRKALWINCALCNLRDTWNGIFYRWLKLWTHFGFSIKLHVSQSNLLQSTLLFYSVPKFQAHLHTALFPKHKKGLHQEINSNAWWRWKQLQINKDSLTLEESETLAEGISSHSWLPDYDWWHWAYRDKLQVWRQGQESLGQWSSVGKRTWACQGGRITLT